MPVSASVLLVRAGARICALPIADVIETMRPLAIAPLPGTAPFVRGASVIRGSPVPVVALDAFLGGATARADAKRLVLVRYGARSAALAVDSVIGVAALDLAEGRSVPLLDGGGEGAVEALGALDRDLLVVLRSVRIVPEDAWRAIAEAEVPR